MPYNPQKHHRRSIRLKGYDYSQAGLYFVTICCQNRICRFGHVENDEMILNDAGMMIEKWYYELENKFSDIRCHDMVVMPNHFHCIIENVGAETVGADVGADLCVCPDDGIALTGNALTGEHNPILGEHIGSPLHRVVQWFKTMTTNNYIRGVKQNNWIPFNGKLLQRNYYEHIIRDENDYNRIAHYIMNNPKNWDNDKLK